MEMTTLIIPCYDEAKRLDLPAMRGLLQDGVEVLFVDDGSKDDTRAILERFAAEHPDHVRVLALEQNSGKAEAVRRGLLSAIENKRAQIVGYLDADLATPPSEILRLVQIMRANTKAEVMFGARVALMGHRIERRMVRHYLGRVFATIASMTLRLTTYDTQCGAKLLRVTPALLAALGERFLSRWAFDVELLGRMLAGTPTVAGITPADLWEEPLLEWRDVKGSKLAPKQMSKALIDLGRIEMDLRRRRAATQHLARRQADASPASTAASS